MFYWFFHTRLVSNKTQSIKCLRRRASVSPYTYRSCYCYHMLCVCCSCSGTVCKGRYFQVKTYGMKYVDVRIYKKNKKQQNYFCQQMHCLLKHKMLQFSLKISLYMAATCFGPSWTIIREHMMEPC